MGCFQSNIEIEEVALTTHENANKADLRLTKTEEGFDDLSLDSHADNTYSPIFETSKTRFGDSLICDTRSKSISLHRMDFEAAFLQSSGNHIKIPTNAENN
jgi:hypothetical protein